MTLERVRLEESPKRCRGTLLIALLLWARFASGVAAQETPAVPPAPTPKESTLEKVEEKAEKAAEVVGETAEKAAEETAERAAEVVFSFGKDIADAPSRILADVKGLATLESFSILAASGGLAALSREQWDEDVRQDVRNHPRRFGGTLNDVIDNTGASYTHLGGAAVLYGFSLFTQSPLLHEVSLDALHALTIEIPLVMGLKEAFSTERPNGEDDGFPSGHTASTFALAAVIHENFGLIPGLAGYTWGTLVALHRIDTKHHDLSDVIFGAGLGVAIGFAASRNGAPRLADVELKPWLDTRSRAKGLAIELRF